MARHTFEAKFLKVRHHRPGSKHNQRMEAMLQIPGFKHPVWCYVPEPLLAEVTERRLQSLATKLEGSIARVTGRMELKARTPGSGWLHDVTVDLASVRWHTPEGEPQFDQG